MKVRLRRPLGYPMLVITTRKFYRPYRWLNRLLAQGRRKWEIIFVDEQSLRNWRWFPL